MDDFNPAWEDPIREIIESVMAQEHPFDFTCVGSRQTAADVCKWMESVCLLLIKLGGCGYSGGAEGPDDALTRAVKAALEDKSIDRRGYEIARIFIGWFKFNGLIPGDLDGAIVDGSKQAKHQDAEKIAKIAHPAWDKMKGGGQTLQIRNCYQVLTETLANPTRLMMFGASSYDKSGIVPFGGTATAYKIAYVMGVPLFDCTKQEGRDDLIKFIQNEFKDDAEKTKIIDEWKLPEVNTNGCEPWQGRTFDSVGGNSNNWRPSPTPKTDVSATASFEPEIDMDGFDEDIQF